MAFGIRPPLTLGLGLAAVSLALFAIAPVDGSFLTDVPPSMVLLGIGAGIAFNPVSWPRWATSSRTRPGWPRGS